MAHQSPYARFAKRNLTLRDLLAVDRTIAANERTFLGYIRTTLALLATGGTLLHFISAWWATLLGLSLLGAGIPMLGLGLRHFLSRRRSLQPLMAFVEEEAR